MLKKFEAARLAPLAAAADALGVAALVVLVAMAFGAPTGG
jgi:hypothetical protein